MAPRKLSDLDKSNIIELYKQIDQTTSTLADQYGVSNSTISRILKTTLPSDEYAQLVAQKRMSGADRTTGVSTGVRTAPVAASVNTEIATEAEADQLLVASDSAVEPPKLKTAAEKEEAKAKTLSRRRSRTRRSEDEDEQLPLLTGDRSIPERSEALFNETDEPSANASFHDSGLEAIAETEAEEEDDDDDDDDLLGLDEALGDDFGDDDDDEDDDEDDDDAIDLLNPKLPSIVTMEIMPLGEAVLPKPCYLVVDMRSELITRPLSDFADLGQIPIAEEKAKTLPVFDNHRVARRFSRNKQRVIKVPDGSLITRTSPYLQAKGITRLLVDGQVFDLVGSD